MTHRVVATGRSPPSPSGSRWRGKTVLMGTVHYMLPTGTRPAAYLGAPVADDWRWISATHGGEFPREDPNVAGLARTASGTRSSALNPSSEPGGTTSHKDRGPQPRVLRQVPHRRGVLLGRRGARPPRAAKMIVETVRAAPASPSRSLPRLARASTCVLTMRTMSMGRRKVLVALGAELSCSPGPARIGIIAKARLAWASPDKLRARPAVQKPASRLRHPQAHHGPGSLGRLTGGDVDVLVAGVSTSGFHHRRQSLLRADPREAPLGGRRAPHSPSSPGPRQAAPSARAPRRVPGIGARLRARRSLVPLHGPAGRCGPSPLRQGGRGGQRLARGEGCSAASRAARRARCFAGGSRPRAPVARRDHRGGAFPGGRCALPSPDARRHVRTRSSRRRHVVRPARQRPAGRAHRSVVAGALVEGYRARRAR